MEQALGKIRPHVSSSLPHQKTPATLLQALETTFREQNAEKSSTAYFAALLTTLDGTIQKKDLGLGDGDVLPAEIYLLALVAPFVPQPVVRSNLNTLLSLTAPLFPLISSHAPSLRSQLSLYSTIIQSLDRSQLELQAIRQSFASILRLTLDTRPKVRRKAAEAIKEVLSVPPSPLVRHPYADVVAEWATSALATASTGAFPRSKGSSKTQETPDDSAIHILAFLRPILFKLPSSSLPVITTSLLSLPRLGNPYLSQSAYSILSDLFSDSEETNVTSQIPDVIKAVLSSPPSKSHTTLLPAWVQVLGNAMLAYHAVDPNACASELGKVWKAVWTYLESSDASTRKAVAESLDSLAQCFTPGLMTSAIQETEGPEPKSILRKIISQTMSALDSLSYSRSIPELLSIISSLLTNLRYRNGPRTSPTTAESLLIPIIHKVAELRTQKGFEYKEAADSSLAAAMSVLGPKVLLRTLPLNLEPSDRKAGLKPRAFLLPLLVQPHSSPLGHFVSYFVPLSERMFDLQQTADAEGRQSEAKVWSVLVSQIWTGFAGYCWAPADLRESLIPAFSQLLSQLLYSQAELRPAVLKALKILVDSNLSLTSPHDDSSSKPVEPISSEEAEKNVAFLRSQTESWLAVFFNVFGTVDRNDRGVVGDVISAWAAIAGEDEITKAYQKVIGLFKQNLASSLRSTQPVSQGPNEEASVTATMQDILILLLPYLSSADATALFQTCLIGEVLTHKDNGIQKRGYKTLSKLVDSEKMKLDAESVLRQLDEFADGLSSAAKKDRFNLLAQLVPRIPPSAMHVIPSLIPEAVLGTKEPSQKARTAAFELIVSMGKKMSQGGVVKRDLVDGMDEDSAGEATASIEEYVTMIAGGLAGATPHMISATVTAISRLVFEFKDTLTPQMQTEVFTTLLVFLTSANREIVKSALGYTKLAIHTLPADLLRPHLPQLVPALLTWAHDHKNHFKAKVRHVFERMLRRFTWEEIYACVGEDGDAGKVLVNIKKRKERAKRKKARESEDADDEESPAVRPAVGDAFEDVLYGSESELDSDDDEHDERQQSKRGASSKQRKDSERGTRIRIDDGEPMDLLQGVASRITNAQGKRKKPGQDAARFKTDIETGKMLIDEASDSDDNGNKAAMDIEGGAYRESLTSADGFTRGANGRVKFNKDTKKRRREAEEADIDGDAEMVDGDTGKDKGRKNKRHSEVRLGHEFKAKKAGGDVKKGGVDPYAYMSLSQAAKKKGRGKGGHIGIASKR